MQVRSGRTVGVIFALVLAGALGACSSGNKSSGNSSEMSPSVKVNPMAVQAIAKAGPPANATNRTSIGQPPVSINTSNSANDTDSFWVSQIDIDGDGDLEDTQFLWDDEDKVLFAYAETDVWCNDGGTASAAILIGVNAAGNPRNRPAGSGFYAAYLDASECAAAVAGLYGCTFNAQGYVTNWAAAAIDDAGDTVILSGN